MPDTKLTKSAGEHWVCSVMSRLGWGVALTRDGLERTDILAVDPSANPRRLVEVQVKTCNGNTDMANWPISEKAQSLAQSDDEWFVMVALGPAPAEAPRSFILPRNHLVAAAWIRHMHWYTEPGIPAGQRNTGIDRARLQAWVLAGYEDRWDLLNGSAAAAPVLLPPEFRDYALEERIGLPPGHPWNDHLPHW